MWPYSFGRISHDACIVQNYCTRWKSMKPIKIVLFTVAEHSTMATQTECSAPSPRTPTRSIVNDFFWHLFWLDDNNRLEPPATTTSALIKSNKKNTKIFISNFHVRPFIKFNFSCLYSIYFDWRYYLCIGAKKEKTVIFFCKSIK